MEKDLMGRDRIQVAECYLHYIRKELDKGGVYLPSERHQLRLMEKLWAKRARGEDTRYNLVGTRRGPHPEWYLASPYVQGERFLRSLRRILAGEVKKAQKPRQRRYYPGDMDSPVDFDGIEADRMVDMDKEEW